jgi:hypothetical protein
LNKNLEYKTIIINRYMSKRETEIKNVNININNIKKSIDIMYIWFYTLARIIKEV